MFLNHPRSLLLSGLLLLSLITTLAHAAAPIPAPPQIAGTGHLLIDFDSGHVLSESNISQRLEPASLTKIMTAYAVFRELKEGNIKLDEEVLVQEESFCLSCFRVMQKVFCPTLFDN